MTRIVRLIEALVGGMGRITALIIIPLILATAYEVFSRYLFGAPTIWAYELGYILTGSHFLLGASLALLAGAHIRIDLLYSRFSPRGKAAVDLVCYVTLFFPFIVLLSNSLWDYALRSFLSGELSGQSAWSPPIWPFRMVLTLGFVLLALQVFAEILKCVAVLIGRPIPSSERG
ncbi:TRAP transporter small permease subunit [Hwanghaeella sp.]|uniref:TRAP transporter small permease subunit n=1 Tax=Hwanghaeella sp. TaxID=2605943 RepID=UPI003CCBFB2E